MVSVDKDTNSLYLQMFFMWNSFTNVSKSLGDLCMYTMYIQNSNTFCHGRYFLSYDKELWYTSRRFLAHGQKWVTNLNLTKPPISNYYSSHEANPNQNNPSNISLPSIQMGKGNTYRESLITTISIMVVRYSRLCRLTQIRFT